MLANYVESNLKDKLFGIFEPILILLLDRGCEEIFNKFYSNFEARLVEYKELRSEKENIVEILFGLCEYL